MLRYGRALSLQVLLRLTDMVPFKTRLALMCGVLLLIAAVPAAAQLSSSGILDVVTIAYQTAAGQWAAKIKTHALYLFWLLASISMVWTFGMLALRQADIGEFMSELIKFIIFLGFFLWLLNNGPDFATKIINSLRQIGSEATGRKDVLTPSKIVDIGFKIFWKAVDQMSFFSPLASAATLIMSGGILLVLAFIAFGMVQLLCAAWILAYAGMFFLGFGGSRWTSDIAIYYYKSVLGVAAELMTMTLLIGIGQDLLTMFGNANASSPELNLKSLAAMLIASLLLYRLCDSLPGRVASIATGGAIGGSGMGGGMGVAALAAGAAVGGAAVAHVAKNVAGGASAVGAALQAAKVAAAAGSGPGGVAGIGLGAAGRLLSAAGSVASQQLGQGMFGPKGDVAKTFGGQMAEKIRGNSAKADAESDAGATGGSSDSKGSDGASAKGADGQASDQNSKTDKKPEPYDGAAFGGSKTTFSGADASMGGSSPAGWGQSGTTEGGGSQATPAYSAAGGANFGGTGTSGAWGATSSSAGGSGTWGGQSSAPSAAPSGESSGNSIGAGGGSPNTNRASVAPVNSEVAEFAGTAPGK
jgi:type IV secretion system protein VirB6/type IV secretion system protein TrbL